MFCTGGGGGRVYIRVRLYRVERARDLARRNICGVWADVWLRTESTGT